MTLLSLHTELDKNKVGAKAYNLSIMMRAGLNVPRGFVFDTVAFEAWDLEIVRAGIEKVLSSFNAKGYMVRSSAIGEDGEECSFAGQLDSFICGDSLDEIVDKVRLCWESYKNERVTTYQIQNGKKLNGMGVVIQELVNPDYAGVIFSESYLKENSMLCEYL